MKLLNKETCFALPNAKVNKLTSVLTMEFFSAELPLGANEAAAALKIEVFSAKFEDNVREPIGFTVQEVTTPDCSVQEIDLVVEA